MLKQAVNRNIFLIYRLRKTNLLLKFVTNTTKENKSFLYNRLIELGFKLDIDEIHSSLGAARTLIVQRKLKPLLLLSPEALVDFEGLSCPENEEANAVVVGLAPTEFHYERLNEAFRCLNRGAQLIAIHAAKYYRRNDGLALGPGFFVKGLEYSAQCKAELVGKPNIAFFKSALGDIPPDSAIMIGDVSIIF